MKTRIISGLFFLALMAAGSIYAQQGIKVMVPFEFSAGGQTIPSGQYEFIPAGDSKTIRVVGPQGNVAILPVITRLAKEMHTTPNDAHLIFDRMGEKDTLSEIWIPSVDGFLLSSTAAKHEHQILNAPVK